MARSLNKIELIGNLTRDPELRYTPQGTAVCTFGLATNRQWTTDTGEKKEDVEFHRIVSWNKLAELCAQLLGKGRKIYVEGRLQTRRWTAQDGTEKTTVEIVINDMIILDSKFTSSSPSQGDDFDVPDEFPEEQSAIKGEPSEASSGRVQKQSAKKGDDKKKGQDKAEFQKKTGSKKKTESKKENEEDIPF